MTRQRSLFDIVGPVMIGPSSSHTAGAVRLGALARAIFGEQPSSATLGLHGSFASTGHGHGTDLALVAGLLGYTPDDARIRDAFAEAERAGLVVSFETVDLGVAHPNTAVFELVASDGRRMRLVGSSLGAGDVLITTIDDFEVEMGGELPTLVIDHVDRPGEIASVTSVLADAGANIASMRVSREARGARALMLIETDAPVVDEVTRRVAEAPGVTAVRNVAAV
jgi:L-serine dehydratase